MLTSVARAQHVPQQAIGRVVSSLYRSSLDVSFRRTGGLFVLLRNQDNLQKVVRAGDAVGDGNAESDEGRFGAFLRTHRFQGLSRNVVADLAAADGAMVMANSGKILAYSAILNPKRKGRLTGSEGSRTKAAIGASNYGLAIKISSDGEIAFYQAGAKFLAV